MGSSSFIVGTKADPCGGAPVQHHQRVILAALTTTVGFGTLMLSEHRGISASVTWAQWEACACWRRPTSFPVPTGQALPRRKRMTIPEEMRWGTFRIQPSVTRVPPKT